MSVQLGEKIIDPRWDMSAPPQLSTESTDFTFAKFDPIGDATNSVNYNVFTTDTNSFLSLPDAQLEVVFQVTTSGDAALSVADQTALGSNGWLLFQDAQLSINEQVIDKIQNPAHAVHQRNLVEGSKQAIDSMGQNSHYYIDSVPTSASGVSGMVQYVAGMTGTQTGTSPVSFYHETQYVKTSLGGATGVVESVNKNSQFDPSFKRKVDRALTTQRIFLALKDVFPILSVVGLSKGSKIGVELNKISNVAEALFGSQSTTGCKIVISRVALWVPRMRPSLEALARVEKQLSEAPVIQAEYEKIQTYKLPYSTLDAADHTYSLPSKSSSPQRMYVAFSRAVRSTSQHWNPLEYDTPYSKTAALSKIECRLNGKTVPGLVYNPINDRHRILYDLYRMAGKTYNDVDSSPLTVENWSTMFPIIGFDLSYAESSQFESKSYSQIDLFWTTNAVADASYNVFIVLVSKQKTIIDRTSGLLTVKTSA